MVVYNGYKTTNMSRKYLSFTLLCCALAVGYTACQKKANTTNASSTTGTYIPPFSAPPNIAGPSTDKTKLNSLFAEFRSTPETLSVPAGVLATVTGSQGTKLTFYPNAFKEAAGNTIITGTIDLKLIEMYRPGQMIANRATTVSGGSLLSSGGQVYLTATRGGLKVYPSKYGITFPSAAPSTSPMALFFGNSSNEDSLTTWGAASTATGTVTTGTTIDSASSTFGFVFDSCNDYNWINCDYFYSSTAPRTNINVVVPDTTFNGSNSQVFVVLTGINAVTSPTVYDRNTHAFRFLEPSYKIPVGLPCTIVVMTKKSGTYYYFEQTGLTTTNGMSVTAPMTVQTFAYIAGRLSTL